MPRPNKYRAVRTEVDGHSFASKKEARRYGELRIRQKAHQICGLELQPSWDIKVNGIKICTYRADFAYLDLENQCRVVEDVKSKPTRTAVYMLKRKLMRACHGIEIVEI